jgi:hypothetical protein
MGNTFKTAFLLTSMTLLLLIAGRAFGGQRGMLMALIFAAIMNFVSYFFSDKIALAMYRAQPISRDALPRVYNLVERLSQKVGLPMPKVYLIPNDSPNAFATGRNPNHASVAVTQGILGLLNDDELEGVLAHELGHVRNRDILISSVAATIAGAITYLAHIAQWGMIFGGQPDSTRRLALARVFRRRHRRALDRQSVCACERASKDRRLFPAHATYSDAIDGASFHHRALSRRNELRQPVLDPSANRKAHRAVDGTPGGIYAVRQPSAFSRQPSGLN